MIEFTRSNVKAMNDEMVEVLNKYGFKNVNFTTSGARFSPSECTFKIQAVVNGAKSRKETDLDYFAKKHNLDVTKKGPNGERLIEFHTRKRKYPFIYVTPRGTRYKCTVESAKEKFGA